MSMAALAQSEVQVRLRTLSDGLATAVVVSLPWSTSATAILIVAWLVALIPTLQRDDLSEVISRPAAYLPVVLVAIGAIGMLWADVAWAERSRGLSGFLKLLILPLLFGAFQAGMAALGWLGGRVAVTYIGAWDHWVAFGLLVLIGGKMVIEALRDHDEPMAPGTPLLYLGLAVATSIDAAAAGLTLQLLEAPPWLSLLLIGTITALLSALGYAAGRALGHQVGPKLGAVGGLVFDVVTGGGEA